MIKWLERIFRAWGSLVVHHRLAVIICVFGVALACVPTAVSTIRHLDANILNQVSERLPRFKALKESSTEFGGDVFAAAVTLAKPQAGTEAATAELKLFGDLLAKELSQVGLAPEDQQALAAAKLPDTAEAGPWLQQVECKLGAGSQAELSRLVRAHPHLVLDLEAIHEMEGRFQPDALRARLQQVSDDLDSLDPLFSAAREKLLRDPLGIGGLAEKKLDERLALQGQGLVTRPDRYFISPDGTVLLVLARAARSSNNVIYNRILMEACQRAENRAVGAFRARQPQPELTTALKGKQYGQVAKRETATPDLTVSYTGLNAISVENERSLRSDIGIGSALAFLSLIVIFLIAYRSIGLTVNVTLTLFFASLFTLTVAGLHHGRIGVMGAGFACVLIGMGVDYGIMIYGTFRNLRRLEGLDPPTAMRETLVRRGPGVLTACFTTVVGFLGVCIVDFQAIAEFGFLTGVGLIASAVLIFVFFPAFLLAAPGKAERLQRPVTPIGMGRLGRFLSGPRGRWFGVALGAAVGVAGVCLLLFQPPLKPGMESFLGVRFDPDLSNLRSRNAPAFDLREEITTKFGRTLADLRVIVEAPDAAAALAGCEEVLARAAPFVQAGDVREGGSLLRFVPSLGRQHQVLAALQAVDFDALTRRFLDTARAVFGARGEKYFAPFVASLKDFAQEVRQAQPVDLASLLASPVGPVLRQFARVDGAGPARRVRLLAFFHPRNNEYSEEWLRGFAAKLEAAPPAGCAIMVTAGRFVGFELRGSVIRDMEWVFAVVAVLVGIIILFTLRSPKLMALALIPLGFSFLFVLAGVALAERMDWDLSLNFINLMIFPILLGSAVDYGIYMVFDVYSKHRPSVAAVVKETGHSLVLCCATTLGGYGSMIVGNNSGLISFGWTAILGYVGALFAAIVFLPALFCCVPHRAKDEMQDASVSPAEDEKTASAQHVT